ncbi:fluoride efflux transporter CrcB [Sphingomonas profundi]|uniref:fluoride efflux transporter CrcB n=1 Tax=Alterirhizorhabdus profundi TaxID=2681549 RepID=UPI0012E8E913|nr:fluoride efflux transporter CrcB [Sphingomonas profundi]
MPPLLLVMAGGAIGSGLRYAAAAVALRAFGPGFPAGTFAVNLIGGLLMGLLAGILGRAALPAEPLRLFVGVGILGGFTTFSSFSLESYAMLMRGEVALAIGYGLASGVGSIAMLALGVILARAIG